VSDEIVAICLPVREMPMPEVQSRREPCNICAEPVWVSRTTPAEATIICWDCGPGVVNSRDYTAKVTPAQRAQLHRAGLTDADIVRTMQAADRHLGKRKK